MKIFNCQPECKDKAQAWSGGLQIIINSLWYNLYIYGQSAPGGPFHSEFAEGEEVF